MAPRDTDSSLEIRAPKRFSHVGSLRAGEVTHDPRSERFSFDNVTVDLRECRRIDIPAILWCVVFLCLAFRRGANCQLRLPDDAATFDALTSSGAREILAAVGVQFLGYRSISKPSILLPLCILQSFSDVERAANDILDRLMDTPDSGPPNLYATVAETFVELANNGVEHSQSEIGTLGMVALDIGRKTGNFEIAVADGGVGINPALKVATSIDKKRVWNDWSSIEYATGELVSGTGDPHRGIGLFGVAEESRLPGAVLRLNSGRGVLHINEQSQIRAIRNNLFPGTLAYVSIQFPVV